MKVLPFYTSTGMRDAEKVYSQDALLCPRHKFLPFQIQRAHSSANYVNEVKIVDCAGNETDVWGYFRGAQNLLTGWSNYAAPFDYDTFISSGSTILTAIETGAAGICYSNEFALATGESIAVTYSMLLNTGTYPDLLLGDSAAGVYSPLQTMTVGATVTLTASGNNGGNVSILVRASAATSFSAFFTLVKRTNLVLKEFTTYDFITSNGEPLNTLLPYGVYYLKIADDNTTWYSEWFTVKDLQPQVLTGYVSSTYDTFTNSGPNITSAIEIAGAGDAYSNSFSCYTGEKFVFTYDLTLNSGDTPTVRIATTATPLSNIETLEPNLNEAELTAIAGGNLRIRLLTTSATNYSLGNVSLRRKSGEYIHLEFTNSRDFNNGDKSIYYLGGFTQQAYLRAYENLPSHETIEVGDEKNGVFIAEKVVSKYVRSVVSYETRAMYNALRLLPLHDSVKILCEDGVEYTPAVGNVTVPPIDWGTFDTGTLRIEWNETGQQWTNSMDNIV